MGFPPAKPEKKNVWKKNPAEIGLQYPLLVAESCFVPCFGGKKKAAVSMHHTAPGSLVTKT